MEKQITAKLLQLGIKPNYRGFHYLRDIIQTYLHNPISSMMLMYEVTADNFEVTAKRVERAIRTVKEKSAYKCTNKAFIAQLAEE
ncbi:MAG TPA: sporulation initiation factor Spo0A C-terminal domain-containing protein, partial [Flavobacterium sp.]|nr:sporulation initiation factor Spo0A C-terminal domain-containing protein [Flavobacterium sp.]